MSLEFDMYEMIKHIEPEHRRIYAAYDLGWYDAMKTKIKNKKQKSKSNKSDFKISLDDMENQFYFNMPINDMTVDHLRCAVAILRDIIQKEANNERSK